MKLTIDFKNTTKELPKKSGKYLTVKFFDDSEIWLDNMSYSAKYKQFNMRDDSIDDTHIDGILYWAELPSKEQFVKDTMCDCYHVNKVQRFERNSIGNYVSFIKDEPVCYGTKDREPCDCEGNRKYCNFYKEIRDAAENK